MGFFFTGWFVTYIAALPSPRICGVPTDPPIHTPVMDEIFGDHHLESIRTTGCAMGLQ